MLKVWLYCMPVVCDRLLSSSTPPPNRAALSEIALIGLFCEGNFFPRPLADEHRPPPPSQASEATRTPNICTAATAACFASRVETDPTHRLGITRGHRLGRALPPRRHAHTQRTRKPREGWFGYGLLIEGGISPKNVIR